jgi:chemotaxis protein CheD
MDSNEVFNIGKRNHLALRKILWKAGILVEVEAVGGSDSRTIRLEIGTGRVLMRTAAKAEEEICSPLTGQKGTMAYANRRFDCR